MDHGQGVRRSRTVTIALIVYAAFSLIFGGIAATVELWTPPTMLDRADKRGKFESPRPRFGEALGIGLFCALLWPILATCALFDKAAKQ
jgi:hypothetical protein